MELKKGHMKIRVSMKFDLNLYILRILLITSLWPFRYLRNDGQVQTIGLYEYRSEWTHNSVVTKNCSWGGVERGFNWILPLEKCLESFMHLDVFYWIFTNLILKLFFYNPPPTESPLAMPLNHEWIYWIKFLDCQISPQTVICLIFRRNATHFILPFAIVVCVCLSVCLSVCICRICEPQENGLR